MTAQRRPLAALAATMLSLAPRAAAILSYCPAAADNLCYAVGVPDATASAGSGSIYFRITAPTSYQWVALGTGTMMAGSNMFVVYQDGSGNVTLSPRLGTNHVAPSEDTSSDAAQLTLLDGSGVSGGVMTANVRCANCESWGSGSTLALTSTSAPWIGAWKAGSALATTNKNAGLTVHDDTVQYKLDLTKATIASDSNPFVSSSSGGGSDSGGSGSGSGSDSGGSGSDSGGSGSDSGGSGSGSGSDSGGSGSGSSSSSGGVVVAAPPKAAILTAHAVIMALVMVVLYPLGSALMPLLGLWAVHGVWQGLSYLLMWAGFALGVTTAKQRGMLYTDGAKGHTILGTVVVAALAFQPLLGLLHHRHYLQRGGRGVVSHVHIWWGRLLTIVGIVNGGLGLHLARASHHVIIGYSVASAVLFLIYVAAKVVGSRTRSFVPRRLSQKASIGADGQASSSSSHVRGPAGAGAAARPGSATEMTYLQTTRKDQQTSTHVSSRRSVDEDNVHFSERMQREETRFA